MRKLGVGIVLLVLLAACGGDDAPAAPVKPVYPATINIRGDLGLNGATYVRGNLSECAGAGPYADLVVGAPVTVSSGNGKPLAIGKIEYSVGTNVYRNQLDQCVFRWSVYTVPRNGRYLIGIGRQKPLETTFLTLLGRGGIWDMVIQGTATTTSTGLGSIG